MDTPTELARAALAERGVNAATDTQVSRCLALAALHTQMDSKAPYHDAALEMHQLGEVP